MIWDALYIGRSTLYNLSAEVHLKVTMELRHRILDLYYQCYLSGYRCFTKLVVKGRSGVFHDHEFFCSLVQGVSVI